MFDIYRLKMIVMKILNVFESVNLSLFVTVVCMLLFCSRPFSKYFDYTFLGYHLSFEFGFVDNFNT